MERAQSFYEAVLGARLRRESMGAETMALFASDEAGVGGCLLFKTAPGAGQRRTVVYLNANPKLDAVLARVEQAGGSIATPKTMLPGEMGLFAQSSTPKAIGSRLHAGA